MLVDDSAAARAMIRKSLKTLHHDLHLTILEAEGGREMEQLLGDFHVDCLLLDHDMPERNGLMLLKETLRLSPNMAIIMITGAGNEQLAVKALKAGAMDYLVKDNVNPASLRRAILNALERRAMQLEISRQHSELLDAERQRVMIESLGAACHHLGQPLTVASMWLEMVDKKLIEEEDKEMMSKTQSALSEMREILRRMERINAYRTVPYCPEQQHTVKRILDLSDNEDEKPFNIE